jgi:hypothetical protein
VQEKPPSWKRLDRRHYITRAQGNDLGLRYAGETEHHLGKQASEQKKPDQVPIFEQKD